MDSLKCALAAAQVDPLDKRRAAAVLDQQDGLAALRSEFEIPTLGGMGADLVLCQSLDDQATADSPSLYFCGNSLGPLARRTRQIVNEELDVWSQWSVGADAAELTRSALSMGISSTRTDGRACRCIWDSLTRQMDDGGRALQEAPGAPPRRLA